MPRNRRRSTTVLAALAMLALTAPTATAQDEAVPVDAIVGGLGNLVDQLLNGVTRLLNQRLRGLGGLSLA